MDDVALVKTILDLTGFDFLDCLSDIHGNCSGLRVRHEAFRAKDTAETTDNAHHIRCSDDNVEIEPVLFLDLCYEIHLADIICPGFSCLISLCALGKYEDAHRLACAVRKHDSATDLLISMTSVAACTDVSFDCLIKFRDCSLLYDFNSFSHVIQVLAIINLQGFCILLAMFHFI